MGISVIYKNGAFFLKDYQRHDIEKRFHLLTKGGWKHNTRDGWFTTNLMSASLLRDYATDRAKNIIERAFISHSPWKGALFVPKKLKLIPHQPGSALYSLSRNRSYLALAPGLGKTIVAALIAVAMANKIKGCRTVIMVPPFLQLNTLEEFQKWAPTLHTKILDNVDYIVPDVLIVPDSQINNPYLRDYLRFFQPQLLVVDEFHRFKTDTALRSKGMYGHTDNRKRKGERYLPGIMDGKSIINTVVMSGTPMPNRPIELYPMFKKLAGQYINFMTKNQYGNFYCAGFPVKNEWTGQVYGNDFSGCDEVRFKKLMKQVKSKVIIHEDKSITVGEDGFMLRLNKSILGLPKLSEEIVVLGDDMPLKLKAMNAEVMKLYSPKDLIKKFLAIQQGKEVGEELHLMEYRRLLGVHKVKPACEYIEAILEETNENLLIVAYHKEVIAMIAARLAKYEPYIVTGSVPVMKRQCIVKEYQASKNRRIIIGNLDAIGVGFTITKVHRVPLVEFDWSDGKNRQVIDRAHRYGLKHPLLAEYLCFRNSLDYHTIETLLDKQQITAHV